jgi:dihydroxy-acid dehydratase
LIHELKHCALTAPSSHGFVIGHVTPEAQVGGPIALVQDGDMIHIDAEVNSISMDVSDAELEKRRKSWTAPPLKVTSGTLYKYTKLVSDASQGCGESWKRCSLSWSPD